MSSKIINYFVSGMLSEERELFVRRIAEILAKTQYAELLADGVPVAAICQDEDKCTAMLEIRGAHDVKIIETKITEDFMVRIEYSYAVTRYRKKGSNEYYGRDTKDDEYCEEFDRVSTSSRTITAGETSKYGIRVEYV